MKLRLVVAVVLLAAVGCGSDPTAEAEAYQPETSTAKDGSATTEVVSEVPVPEALAKSIAVDPGPTSADELTFIAEQESADAVSLVQIDPTTGDSTNPPGPDPGGWLTEISMLATPEWLAIGAEVCADRPSDGDTGPFCSDGGEQMIFLRDANGAWRDAPVPTTSNPYLLMLDENVVVWDSADGLFETSLDELTTTKRGPSPPDAAGACTALDPGVRVSLDLAQSSAQVLRPSGQEVVPIGPALDGWGDGFTPPVCFGSDTTLVVTGFGSLLPPEGVEVPDVPLGDPVNDTIDSPEPVAQAPREQLPPEGADVPEGSLGHPVTDTIDRPQPVAQAPREFPARFVEVDSQTTTDLPFSSLHSAATAGEWVLAIGSEGSEWSLWGTGPDGVIEVDGLPFRSSILASGTGAIAVEPDETGAISTMRIIRLGS